MALIKDLTSSVMTGVSSFGNKALDAFGINQATLSGAIDIVVIRHPPGSQPRCFEADYGQHSSHKMRHAKFAMDDLGDYNEEHRTKKDYLVCSPFHVRFGKLQLLRSNEVNVSITINGEPIDNLQMKLGSAGEAYFVVPTTKPHQHRNLLTSPLIRPMTASGGANGSGDGVNGNDTIVTSPSAAPPPPPLHLNKINSVLTATDHPLPTVRSGIALNLLTEFDKVADDGHCNTSIMITTPMQPLDATPRHLMTPNDKDDHHTNHSINSLSTNNVVSTVMNVNVNSNIGAVAPPPPPDHGAIIDAEHSGNNAFDGTHHRASIITKPDIVGLNGDQGTKNTISAMTDDPPPPPPPPIIPMEGPQPLSPSSSVTSSILEDREVLSRLSLNTGTDTGTDNESVIGTDNESVIESMDGFTNFSNLSATHVMIEHIGMSLCGHLLTADSETKNKKLFEDHQISYDQFCANPSVLFDGNLIILYRGRLYPAKIAFPMVFALLSFGQPLSQKALKELNKKEEKEEKKQLKNEDHPEEAVDGNDYSWYWSWLTRKRKKKKRKKKSMSIPKRPTVSTTTMDDAEVDIASKGVLLANGAMGYYRKSLRPTSEMLSKLPLKKGANNITFTVSSTLQGTQSVNACIFLWDSTSKIVISDVDGTITKSDVMGHVAPMIVGSQWSHNGVAELFTNIEANGYRMLYLTSRGIGQSSVTRSYLFENVKQRNFSLPAGPMIMSPDSLTTAFYREVIVKRPQEFKIPALSNIASLFPKNHNPFYCGFGNRETDKESYLKVGVPKHRIFIIKPSGDINTNNALFRTTYDELNIDVDSLFMDRHNRHSRDIEEFNNFNYWSNTSLYITMPESTDSDRESPVTNSNLNPDHTTKPKEESSSLLEEERTDSNNVVLMRMQSVAESNVRPKLQSMDTVTEIMHCKEVEDDGKESNVDQAEETTPVTPN